MKPVITNLMNPETSMKLLNTLRQAENVLGKHLTILQIHWEKEDRNGTKRDVIQEEINRSMEVYIKAGNAVAQAEREIRQRYESAAEAFYRETGMMAPGKDSRDGAFSYEEREAAWSEFVTNGMTGEGLK